MGAVIGTSVVSALAIAPAFAAAAVSQSSAQALNLTIAGTPVISQLVNASNDGTTETFNNSSTLPNIVSAIPANALIGAGVMVQEARALNTGNSYACSGIAGTGSTGIVNIGSGGCNLDGKPLTISLANISLGNALLGSNSVLGNALNSAPLIGTILSTLGLTLNQLTTQVSNALAATPLGQVSVGGSLSAIEGNCFATPTAATGSAHLVDTQGGQGAASSIGITVPNGTGGTQTIHLLDLPANPGPNTHLPVDLSAVTATLTTALQTDLTNSVGGALAGINPVVAGAQNAVLVPLSAALTPLTTAIAQNLLDITLNKQVVADSGRSIAVTALDAQVVPAAAAALPGGSSLISGALGKVTCGPNAGRSITPPTSTPTPPGNPSGPNTPAVVDAGLTGQSSHTARDVLAATTALMMLAGTAGLIGYRRMLTK